MLYGSIEAFTFGLDVDVLRFLWGALSACVVAAVWLGGAKEGGTDEKEDVRARVETAFHTFSNLVALYVSRRDGARRRDVGSISVGEGLPDVASESQDSTENADSRAPYAQTGDGQDLQINSIDFWREDYWNFDINLEGDLFAADEERKENVDAWKESLKEEEDDKKEKKNSEEERNCEDDEPNKGRANYFGAFFRNRNYPPDVTDPDVQERKRERDANDTPRWRRRDDARDESNFESNDGESVDKNATSFDDSSEQDSVDWEEPVLWNEGPDYEYLEDETVSLDDKISYLRKRVDEGDEESRVELARMLVQKAAISNVKDGKTALKGLDEAERILREVGAQHESDSYDDGEYSELLGQVLLQRPVFYLRNGLKPPMKTANVALNQIRSWAENSFSFESRRLLATAWQTHGNCLLASGGDSSALFSLRESREMFESLVEEGCEEAEPSLAFVASSTAETYASIGDFSKALDAYREALTVLDKYSDQEAFLAEKVNVFFKMSFVFRKLGDDENAVRALQSALESEERLVSFNEGVYFAPLAQLLQTYAELLASNGNYEDAIASLDRAVSTLKRVLAYDAALSRRVLAYAHIENILRRRAALYMWQERYARAAEDVGESLEYLTLAIKKEDEFDPSLQIVFSSCILYDLCVVQGLWNYAAKTQESLDQILARFTPEESRKVASLYAQLLLQRHILLARSERSAEAMKATSKAIETLEALQEETLEDGGAFRDSLLSKAYCQRASFLVGSNGNKKIMSGALDDYRRARELSERELTGGRADADFYPFYLDLLGQKAAIELRDNLLDETYDDLRRSFTIVVGLLKERRWRFLDELAKLSRLAVLWARKSAGEFLTLRVVWLFLAYARKLRRRYVESDWSADEQDGDSPQSRTILMNLEAFVADMRRARADLLSSCDWNDEFEPFCRLDDSFFQKSARRNDSSENEGADDDSSFNLDALRETFVRENLADDLKTRTIFLDYEFGLRAIVRRVASGEIDLAYALYQFLDKTTDLYIERNALFLATEETCEITKVFEGVLEQRQYGEDKGDLSESNVDEEENRFWTQTLPFWELQAALLARSSVEALEAQKGDSSEPQEPENAQDANASERESMESLWVKIASMRTETAYLKAIRAVKKIPSSEPTAIARLGAIVGAYFAWLVRMGRKEEGVAFARSEGVAVEGRYDGSPVKFLAVSLYYDYISNVAADYVDDHILAKECLLKVYDEIKDNRAFLGDKSPLLERLANVERRLATFAFEEGAKEEGNRRLRSSVDRYARCFFNGRFQKQVFDGFAEVLGALFCSDSDENGKLASVLFHKLEKNAKSWGKKTRRETLSSMWILLGQAAAYFDEKRGCFYEANRIYQERDAFIDDFFPDAFEFNFPLAPEKCNEADFYIRNGDRKRGIDALETAIDARRIHLSTLSKLRAFVESEDYFPFQKIADDYRRQIDFANASIAQLKIGYERNDEQGREIVKEILPLMEEKPEVAARLLPTDAKKQRFARLRAKWIARVGWFLRKRKEEEASTSARPLPEDESTSYLQTYFSMRGHAAMLEIETLGYELARESLLALTREIRLNLGRNSMTERTCLYYWADFAVDFERWDDVIRFASRMFRRARLNKKDGEGFLPYYVDALKISAFARLQRRRLGDLYRAEREVKRMLKLLYAEFRARRFALRSFFTEALFLRAIIEREKGRKAEALKDAERASRLMERARKRGVGTPTRYVEALTEPFLTSLRAELSKDAEFQGEKNDAQ